MKKQRHFSYNMILLFILTVLLIAVYTYTLQKSYANNTLEAAIERDTECSDAIHRLVSNKFTREDYSQINTIEDMQTERYKELQTELNELRTLNSTRYLYTAKRNDEGKLIYLIDGLDLGAEDFAYPGTYIEDEMIPYIDAALSGETIYSQEIMDTTWGHIFTACYPVWASDGSNDIIGALCIEIDMESSYKFLEASNHRTMSIASAAVVLMILLSIGIYYVFKSQKQKEVEQQKLLEETAIAAEAANKAKSSFLFNMSHDIRTPMNAIIGYAELADKYLDSPDKLEHYLQNIQTCGQKMLSIIDNVLELSRIENGNVTLDESVVETGSILEECLVMMKTEAENKHQTMTISKEILHPYVYLDVSRISEIILNLVSNAIKYTGEGGKIECSIRQTPLKREGFCTWIFSVRDNGIGMSEEFQSHIYEDFAREHSSTASGISGTGLGMGIVKKLVDLMEGSIEIQSKLGVGSTFTVKIPCRIASKEDAQPKRANIHLDSKKVQGKRLLLAEDNDINAEIAIELLKEEGIEVDRAENGVKCMEMLERADAHYYAAILMDIQMPVLDGYRTTEKIRKLDDPDRATIPIIAMTANAFAEDRAKALSVGMNDHVAKPIDMNQLLPTLQKYM